MLDHTSDRSFRRTLSTTLLALGLCLCAAPALAQTTHRPISEFVEAQGTFCIPDGQGGCTIFVPPVANFVGFTDTVHDRAISFDYAGLADAPGALDGALGTTFTGDILERTLKDGSVIITVHLQTSNALAWVIPFDPNAGGNQFNDNPLIFGARVNDILAGATPAVGDCKLDLEFTNAAPGLPIPDFEQLLFAAGDGQEMRSVKFEGTANGTFTAGGSGKVHVREVGILDNGFHGAVADGFPAEFITLIQD